MINTRNFILLLLPGTGLLNSGTPRGCTTLIGTTFQPRTPKPTNAELFG